MTLRPLCEDVYSTGRQAGIGYDVNAKSQCYGVCGWANVRLVGFHGTRLKIHTQTHAHQLVLLVFFFLFSVLTKQRGCLFLLFFSFPFDSACINKKITNMLFIFGALWKPQKYAIDYYYYLSNAHAVYTHSIIQAFSEDVYNTHNNMFT